MAPTDGPVSLLVVDDEEAIRNALRKYLVHQGYEVSVAATGEEALAILQRQKITGMLLDVNLPGTNGIDLVPRILELEPDAAILMLTAVNDATAAALCMQRGALDYLTQADRPGPPRPRHPAGARAPRHAHRGPADQPLAQGRGRARARPSAGTSAPTWSGSRSPRSRRWSTRSRPRTPTCAATPRASPTCRPASPPSWAARRRGDRAGAHRGPAARHRQDRHPRGGPQQAGPADRRGVRAREAARASSARRSWRRWSTCGT